MDLGILSRHAAIDVAELIDGSTVCSDGVGSYILIEVDSLKPNSAITASVPTLYEGEYAKWGVWDNEHNSPVETFEYNAYTDPRLVARWINDYIDVWVERTNEKFAVSETV